MADESFSAKHALSLATFVRLKDIVRELEDNEKRLDRDLPGSSIEFKMGGEEMSWYVAYKTSAEAVSLPPIDRFDIKG